MTEDIPRKIFESVPDVMPKDSHEKIPGEAPMEPDPVEIAKHLINEFSDKFSEKTIERPLAAMDGLDIIGLEKILRGVGKLRWDQNDPLNTGAIAPLAAAIAYRDKIHEKKDMPQGPVAG